MSDSHNSNLNPALFQRRFNEVDPQSGPVRQLKHPVFRDRRRVEDRMGSRAGIVPLAGFGGVQLDGADMHVRQMADHRLGLVGDEFDAVGLRDGGAALQAGDAAHFHDIGLDHGHAGFDQLDQTARGVGLFPRRDGDGELDAQRQATNQAFLPNRI